MFKCSENYSSFGALITLSFLLYLFYLCCIFPCSLVFPLLSHSKPHPRILPIVYFKGQCLCTWVCFVIIYKLCCCSLSDMIFLDRLYSFHMLFLNNLANPSTDVLSVVSIKYTIFVSWSTTTKIVLYSWAKGSLVIKSANMCIQGFSGIELGINLPASYSIQFLFLWQKSHPFIYLFISFVTSGHKKFLVTSSTIFHCPLCSSTSILWYNLIISALNISFLDTYTFPSLYITLSTSLYSLSLNIFTSAHFISSTTFTTSLSFTFDHLTFSSRSTPSTITSTFSVFLTSSHSGFTNVSFLLFFSTSTS